MTVSLKHKFTSAISDGGDTSLVQPSNWNDQHDLTLATGTLLGRTTAGTGAAEEISAGTGLSLSAGSLSISTVPVANGGTGATTANAGLTGLTTLTSTATAAGTTVLTNSSTYFQLFTGTSTQTITLPVTSTLATGWTFHIINNSTGNLTVNSSGGNLVITVLPGTTAMVTCIGTTLTTAADWESGLTDFSTATGTGSVVLSASPTLTGALAITGGTVTASTPLLDLTQTWNNAAVTFTGIKANVTDTASGASSLLMDLQVGGSSKFKIGKDGTALSSTGFRSSVNSGGISLVENSQYVGIYSNNAVQAYLNGTSWTYGSSIVVGWSPGSATSGSVDLFLRRRGTANLQLGAADAAAPVAQTLSVQSVVAGTSNTAGANLTITGSQGTGTGAGGSIIFQVAPAGTAGTAQNALATALTINPDRSINVTDTNTTASALLGLNSISIGFSSSSFIGVYISGAKRAQIGNSSFTVNSAGFFAASSDGNASTPDTYLSRRGAANWRLGAADAAAPVAQTLSVQSVVAGTSNTAGANLTITGSQGTGTGAGGNIIFQTAPAGASGTSQNALANTLTLLSTGQALVGAVNNPAAALINTTADSFIGTTATGSSQVRLISSSATTSEGGWLVFTRTAGGSLTSPTATASGATIGNILFQGYDGSARQSGAQISAITGGLFSGSSSPAYLTFSTTASGSITLTERLRIDSTGAWGLAGANYGTSGQVLTSNGSASAPTWQAIFTTSSTTSVTSPLAWNSDSYEQYSVTAQATALTINADAGTPVDGQKIIFRFKDNGTARVLTFTGGVTKGFRPIGVTMTVSGSNFTYTTTISKITYFGCVYNASDSRWDVVAISQEA